MLCLGGVSESFGTWSKIENTYFLLSIKNEKWVFFKNLSSKLKMLLIGHWPHLWVCNTCIRTPLTFFHVWNAHYERCEPLF